MIPIFLGLMLAALVASIAALFQGVSIANTSGELRAAAVSTHQLMGLSAAVLLLVCQCAVFVYFLGTGKAIKTAVEKRGLSPELAIQTRKLKGKTFPFATFSALAVVAGAVLAGGASPQTHATWMYIALGITLISIPFELRSIRENSKLMDQTGNALESAESKLVEQGVSLEDPDAAPPIFIIGRFLVVVAGSTWLVFAYRKLVMRAEPEPWPGYVLVFAITLLIGVPFMLSGRRRTIDSSSASASAPSEN
ncbi:MAG: hypothetical protein ACKVS6_13480 [Planctomycetota bacterium]